MMQERKGKRAAMQLLIQRRREGEKGQGDASCFQVVVDMIPFSETECIAYGAAFINVASIERAEK